MKSDWQRVKLGEVADLTMGQSPQGKDMNTHSEGVPFLQGNRTFGHLFPSFDTWTTAPTKMAKSGDVIMSVRAPVGDLNIAPADLCLGRGVCSMRMKNGEQRYLYYLMRVVRQRLIQQENGTTFGSVNRNDINGLEVNLPPLPTQRRIAAVLGALDDKIEQNRKMNANLEAQAQALFKSWFVDFGPWRGKMPAGWKMGKLFDVADIFDSKRIPLSSRQRENMRGIYPYYGATSVMDYVNDYIFDGTYVLMGEDGSVARDDGLPYLQYVSCKFWPNNHAHVLKGKACYSTEMLYCLLSQTNIRALVTGAVQQKLSQANMGKIEVLIPVQEHAEQFRSLLQPLFLKRMALVRESEKLAELRDTLLPKLMSGELEVAG